MSGKTEVNCGLSLPAIFEEMLPTNQIFAVIIYGTHSHATTSFITQNGSKAVSLDLAFNSGNGEWSVFYCLRSNNGDRLICLTSLSKLKRIMCNLHEKYIPNFRR